MATVYGHPIPGIFYFCVSSLLTKPRTLRHECHARAQALKTEAVTQREVRDQARAAVKDSEDPAKAQRAAENEATRIREHAVEAIQALEVQ